MFQGKEIKVKLSEEANEVYTELISLVEEEKQKGIESSFSSNTIAVYNSGN